MQLRVVEKNEEANNVARKKKQEQEADAGFGQAAPAAGGSRLTPVEIQQKVFRLAFRGYNERDVDEFLDHITEDFAALHEENKRLREQLGGGGAGEDVSAARSQAEAIVREAREHAARLTEDASPSGAGGGVSPTFLLRERDFLQRMAQSVQDHARWLKEEAKRQRAASGVAQAVPVKPAKPAQSSKKTRGSSASAKKADKAPASEASAAPTAATNASAAEATAAWGPPQEGMADPEGSWSQERAAGDPDPLLSAWESAFTAEGSETPGGAEGNAKEGEPSLKELFWGEE
jgi:DivIVA domain-containing protein